MTSKPRTESERYCAQRKQEKLEQLRSELKPDNQNDPFDEFDMLTLGNVVPALGSAPGDR
jgi:hypothetical protein